MLHLIASDACFDYYSLISDGLDGTPKAISKLRQFGSAAKALPTMIHELLRY